MAERQLIALPLAVNNDQKWHTLVLSSDDIKGVDVEWDKEDQTYEVYILVGANRERYEVATGLNDLLTAINMVGINDPWNALTNVLAAEPSE